MNVTAGLLTAILMTAGIASADEVDVVRDRCEGCHRGSMSLAGRDVGEIAAGIRSIRDGERAHPPLGLPDERDAAIEVLAARLAQGSP